MYLRFTVINCIDLDTFSSQGFITVKSDFENVQQEWYLNITPIISVSKLQLLFFIHNANIITFTPPKFYQTPSIFPASWMVPIRRRPEFFVAKSIRSPPPTRLHSISNLRLLLLFIVVLSVSSLLFTIIHPLFNSRLLSLIISTIFIIQLARARSQVFQRRCRFLAI